MKNVYNKNILKLCLVGIFSALSVVLAVLIHLPLIPAVSFLEYDPADMPIFLISAILGPTAGLTMTAIVALLQGITVSAASGWIGILMHFLATGSFVLLECLTLHRLRKTKLPDTVSMALAFCAGILTMTTVMVLWNLVFTPFFMNISMTEFLPFLPYILLFNFLKATINAGGALILWYLLRRPIQKYIPRT